jgi:rSAM/selenodomain-associated transferase 2
MPLVTIVIPVLADSDAASALLAQVPDTPEVEAILVDGGHDGRLDRLVATRPHTRLYRTLPGRGRQMNAGARGATGEWLLFLHADSDLPAGWLEALRSVNRGVVGGWFRFALDDRAWQARVIERLVAWRVRWLRLPYGDQGLFVRRQIFEAMGGFREWPLFEDLDFVRRLPRAGRVTEVPLPLRTSARRWKRDGWLRRSARNVLLTTLYFAGASPAWLARRYRSGHE